MPQTKQGPYVYITTFEKKLSMIKIYFFIIDNYWNGNFVYD